jgi:RNA polymerase sigma factor (sigma-70 family)
VHEIFLKLWEFRENLELNGNFSAYLFRSAHNKAVDETRKMVSGRRLKNEFILNYQELTTLQNESPEELNHNDRLVEEALGSLPPQRRRVYELCRIQGKSYIQAAEEMNISANTVKEHMTKALASLRFFISNRGELTLVILLLGNIL